MRCRRRDVEMFAFKTSGAPEACCRCRDEKVWRYGDGLQACRCGDVRVCSSGALQSKRVDVEA